MGFWRRYKGDKKMNNNNECLKNSKFIDEKLLLQEEKKLYSAFLDLQKKKSELNEIDTNLLSDEQQKKLDFDTFRISSKIIEMSSELRKLKENRDFMEKENSIEDKMLNLESKSNAYHYLGCKDRHITRLMNWIKILEEFKDEIAQSGMDKELEDEIKNIVSRLVKELGARIQMVFM